MAGQSSIPGINASNERWAMIERLGKVNLYWHTLRHLRAEQVFGRLRLGLRRMVPGRLDESNIPEVRARPEFRGQWSLPAARIPSLLARRRFSFLNETREISGIGDWDNPAWALLWRYNLHYFDDLNALASHERTEWQVALVNDWIRENRSADSTAFAPYPCSLRIVNWIKWSLSRRRLGIEPSAEFVASLAAQARLLSQRLEHHLLGNHLFANAKALVFAGVYFSGPESQRWLQVGLSILSREMKEQILDDGAQFELTPMYHSLALEDLLDLANLWSHCPQAVPPAHAHLVDLVRSTITPMRRWLAMMCHPDGKISFFNDAAFNIAPSPAELDAYARRLGFPEQAAPTDGITHLQASGYLRCQRDGLVALLDCAEVGPSYLPGHAHADTLSFELSHGQERLLVNSGTSQYGLGPQREYERSTAAHNTVEVDEQSSSQVWAGFRVARRAFPGSLKIEQQAGVWNITGSHDGYHRLPGAVSHERRWTFGDRGTMTVTDRLAGQWTKATGRLFLSPDCQSSPDDGDGPKRVAFRSQRSRLSIGLSADSEGQLLKTASLWSPEFGVRQASSCVSYPVGRTGAQVTITVGSG